MTAIDSGRASSGLETLRTGLRLTPEFRQGLGVTLALAFVATVGRIVVPVAVQQTLDRGLGRPGGPDIGFIRTAVIISAVAVVVTALSAYRMNVRLYRTSEGGLAALRVRAFRHVHDLSMLTQSAERRGGLVSRVTTDVDQISQFMQYGGLMIIIAGGQLVVASVLMLIYSWPLALLVWAVFTPLALALRYFQRWLSGAYGAARERVGDMLSAVGESVVGASVIRAYGAEARTARRIDASVNEYRDAQTRAQRLVAATFPSTELAAAIATAAVVVAGTVLGIGGHLSAGRLVAFLFLVTLFVSPLQVATEVLNDAQNAIAGWRRVLGVLEAEPDVADPGEEGRELPRGVIDVRFDKVSFAYPGGPTVLHEVSADIAPRLARRGRRRDRLGEDDLRQAAHPADGPRLRAGAHRRGAAHRHPVLLAARADRDGAPGRLPVRRHAWPATSGTAAWTPPTRTSCSPSPSWGWPTGWTACPTG